MQSPSKSSFYRNEKTLLKISDYKDYEYRKVQKKGKTELTLISAILYRYNN